MATTVKRTKAWKEKLPPGKSYAIDDALKLVGTTVVLHNGTIRTVLVGSGGTYLATGGDDAFVKVWNLAEANTSSLPATLPASDSFAAIQPLRGLAFAPKGYRIAYAHNGGASLWFPNASAAPEFFEWKGSHLDVGFSPDGRFLVTSMQENALHGWRLADKKHMRMTGYPGKTRSLSWSHDGAWLATSGADAAIVWPFKDKDGPMGKGPRECGVREARVTKVAFHPRALVVAIGYADGLVLLVRLADGAEILVRLPGDGAVSALGWNATGSRLLFGLDSGAAGLLSLPA